MSCPTKFLSVMASKLQVVLVVLLCVLSVSGFAQLDIEDPNWQYEQANYPPPPTTGSGPDHDMIVEWECDILSSSQEQSLARKVHDYEDSTSTQIAIVTVGKLHTSVQDYTTKLFNYWKVGQAGKNNGLLILVAPNQRKYWITKGYGIDPYLTAGEIRAIGEQQMLPAFKEGNYYKGIDQALDALYGQITGNFEQGPAKETPFWIKVLPVLFIVFIVYLIIKYGDKGGGNFTTMNRGGRRSGRYGSPWIFPTGTGGGGGFGGGGGWGGFGGGLSGGGGAGGGW